MERRLGGLTDIERVAVKLAEALELAAKVEHSDVLRYLIEVALTEASEDYFRRLPVGHPDRI